jgi:hypothetical protein
MSKGILQLALNGSIPLQLEYRAASGCREDRERYRDSAERNIAELACWFAGIDELSAIED